ncbi:MAG: hypothetical protein IJX89_02330 [Alphaproteobacteria bacterium]|nr:hypothetical protein [Alphaproteobacteria bacterium]
MKKHFIFLAIAISPITTNAATYNLDSSYEIVGDSDYSYFSNGSTAYNCGGLANTGNNDIIVEHGESVQIGAVKTLYYCCDNGENSDGYWIKFAGEDSVPSYTCPSVTQYTALGNHKYCAAQKNATHDWCANSTSSGIIDSTEQEENGCTYTDKTCTTFTHCAGNYYKDSTGCHECPYGGTIAKPAGLTYHTYGITNCYVSIGKNYTDDTGTFIITAGGGNCFWTE